MKPIISIVMPAFNAQKHLSEAINTILQQSFTDFELIVVDDGSTDQTVDILIRAAKEDERIKVFHQKNAGVSAARNFGLTRIEGTYFTFVDADDLVHPDLLYSMHQAIILHSAQMVNCGKQPFSETVTLRTQIFDLSSLAILSTEQALKRFFATEIESGPWGKLYSSAHFLAHRFVPDIGYMEDALYVFNCLKETTVLVDIPSPLYGYRQHKESVTHVVRPKYIEDSLFVGKEIHKGCLKESWLDHLRPDMNSFLLQQCALISISKLLYATENHWALCVKIREFVQKELQLSLSTLKTLPHCTVDNSRANILFAPVWLANIVFIIKHWYTQQRVKRKLKQKKG